MEASKRGLPLCFLFRKLDYSQWSRVYFGDYAGKPLVENGPKSSLRRALLKYHPGVEMFWISFSMPRPLTDILSPISWQTSSLAIFRNLNITLEIKVPMRIATLEFPKSLHFSVRRKTYGSIITPANNGLYYSRLDPHFVLLVSRILLNYCGPSFNWIMNMLGECT